MELTVFGIQTLEWTIDTLQQATSPGVPFVRPSKRVSKPKPKAPRASSEAEDDIDDGMGGFITDDEAFDAEGSEEEEMVDHMEDSDDEFVEGDRPRKGQRFLNRSIENPSTPVRKSQSTKRASEIIDLTDSPPLAIDLVTPEKRSPAMPKVQKVKLMNRGVSPLVISSDSEAELPPFTNPMAIAEFPYEFWEKAGDRERLLIRIFYKLRNPQHILSLFVGCKEEKLWELMCQVLRALQVGNEEVDGMNSTTFDKLSAIAQVLAMYMECKFVEWGREMHEMLCRVLLGAKGWWHGFYKHCSRMEKFLDGSYVPEPRSPLLLSNFANLKPKKRQLLESDDDDEGPTKRRRVRGSTTASEDIPEQLSPSMKRKRPVAEDLNARNLRTRNHERLAEQEKRRRVLKAALAQSGHTLGSGKAKYIINDAAALDQGHVYVNEDIASSIKPHQVEGVRFMWNQVIAGADDSSSQGCLLAHTMGLGKTMQVITLLVAIEAAASSSDPSVSSQIPSCLKGTTKTLILCPPGLIDNWWDECLRWAPENPSNRTVLGGLYKVSSALSVAERLQEISAWHEAGGALIMGYEMLRSFVQNKEKANGPAPLTEDEHERVLEQLLKGPDMIIADEAHKLKNAKSGIAEAASQFESTRRIALTGSPLANNVEEYHSMIDFVAPNYLGNVVEFRAHYKEPIEAGLFQESLPSEVKLSRKRLWALNEELKLKVHRMDVSVLKNDLPLKKEFVISVPLTDLQRKVYSSYVKSLQVDTQQLTNDGEVKQTTIWSWLSMLTLLCNHPWCFNAKIEEGTGAKPKSITPDDATDDNAIPLMADVPPTKTTLSTAFVKEVTQLFEKEDLHVVGLSHKVTLLCQVLDAAKNAGDKTLVFSSSIPTLDFLENLFKRQGRVFARLDGKTPMSKRQGLIKAFNAGGLDIYLISTTAGGLGLNLQSANRVVIFDFKYNPIQEQQAVGRAFRIGQLKPTFVYRFVCGETFEANIHNKTVFKSQLASSVVDKRNLRGAAEKRFGDFLFEPKSIPQKDLSEFEGMDPAVLDKILASQAQTATIRSIVQTDSFEVEDQTLLTVEDKEELSQWLNVKRSAKTGPLPSPQLLAQHPAQSTMQPGSSATPRGQTRHPAQPMMQPGPSTAAQSYAQHLNQSVNRPGLLAMSRPQPTKYGNPSNETSIRPPLGAPRGPSTPSSNAKSSSSFTSSGFDRSNPPIMGANTRALSKTPSPYRKAEEARHQASMVSSARNSNGTPGDRVSLPASGGGSQRSKPNKPVKDFFPVLADGYKSKMSDGAIASATPSTARTSPLPEVVRQRIRAVAEEVMTTVTKHSTPGPDRQQQMNRVSEMLAANPAIVCQLVEAELTADDFVQGLTSRGSGSHPQTVCIVQSSLPSATTPSQHEAHVVESCQSSLMTSTSQPILPPQDSSKEENFKGLPQNELERYMSNNNLSIIGGRPESIDRCRDQEPDLTPANDTSHWVLPEKQGGSLTGVAAEVTSAIAPARNSAPMESGNNFTRLLKRILNPGC
ncbi:hypothetical protein DL98DRAFT_480893 [Cadophora sp. DSE1049]|nr:hypothetical protein DL98DRAFT_480893 [Cadophora sp. DSE1049]